MGNLTWFKWLFKSSFQKCVWRTGEKVNEVFQVLSLIVILQSRTFLIFNKHRNLLPAKVFFFSPYAMKMSVYRYEKIGFFWFLNENSFLFLAFLFLDGLHLFIRVLENLTMFVVNLKSHTPKPWILLNFLFFMRYSWARLYIWLIGIICTPVYKYLHL